LLVDYETGELRNSFAYYVGGDNNQPGSNTGLPLGSARGDDEPDGQKAKCCIRKRLRYVVVEAACTIFLFVFDEGISSAQQSKILVLETRLAPRTLSDQEVAEIVAKLKRFGGQEFTIGTYDGEAASLARRLRVILEKADWKWFDPTNQMMPLAGTIGIQVWAWSQGSRNAAGPLVDALNGKAIEAKLLPAARGPPAVDDSKQIEIVVGSKF
jgi:hypothetical protein